MNSEKCCIMLLSASGMRKSHLRGPALRKRRDRDAGGDAKTETERRLAAMACLVLMIPRAAVSVRRRSGAALRGAPLFVFCQATFFRLIALDFMNMLYLKHLDSG